MPNWKKVVVSGSNAELNTLNVTSTGSFGGKLSVSNTSGDTLTLTKDTTEPSLRFEGDTDKDFVLNIEGEVFNISQNDGSTDIFSLDHDTKKATFGGDILLSNASSPKIDIQDTTNSVLLSIYSQNSEAIMGTYSNHPLQLFANSNLALELDTSQNATFEGTVKSKGNVMIEKSSPTLIFNNTAGGGSDPSLSASGTNFTISTTSITPFSLSLNSGSLTLDPGFAGNKALKLVGNYDSAGDVKILEFVRSGDAVAGAIEYNDSTTDMEIGTTTNHPFSIKTNDTRALTIDNSQIPTFQNATTSGTSMYIYNTTDSVLNTKTLIDFRAQASDNSTFYVSGQMGSKAEGTWTSTSGTRDASLIFNTVLDGNNGLALTLAGDKTATFEGNISLTSGNLSITADGSNATTLTESDTGNFAIDSVGNITLDTDNGNVMLKDGGSEFGRFSNSSQDFIIQNTTSDKDILFKGRDSATTFTALSLDMSEEGNATFSGNVDIGDGKKINFGAVPDFSIFHSSSTNINHIQSLLDRQLTLNANIINLRSEANDASYVVVNNTASIFSGDVTISNATPSLTLTDTDNSTDVIFKSLGGVIETDASSHIFSVASNEKMRLDGNGLLGLGTTAPSDYNNNLNNFVIRDSANVGMTLSSGATSTGFIGFGNAEDTVVQGLIQYKHSDNSFRFRTNSLDDRMIISSEGKVGIGSTSPTGILTIASDFGTSETAGLYISNTGSPTAGDLSPIAFTGRSDNWGTVHQGTIALGNADQADGGGYLIFSTSDTGQNSPTERMRISNLGNVSIGGFAPSATPSADYRSLEIGRQGNTITGSPFKSALYLSNNASITAGSTQFTYRNTGEAANRLDLEDGIFKFYNASSGTAGDNITWDERMRIDTNGRVGLGQTSMTYALEVINSTYDNIAWGASSPVAILTQQGSNPAFKTVGELDIEFHTNASERMIIQSDGKVGVGTSDPDELFQVEGASGLDGATPPTIKINSTSVGDWTDNAIFGKLAFGNEDTAGGIACSINAYVDSTTGNNAGLSFSTSAAANTPLERLRIDKDGNVGIGTTTPNPFSWGQRHLTLTKSGTNQFVAVDVIGTGNGGGAINFGGGDGSGTASDILRANINAVDGSHFVINTNNSNSGTSLTERFRITNAGNVGIGTTSPNQKLEVAGRLRVTTDPTFEAYEASDKRGGIQWDATNDLTNIFSVGGPIRFFITDEKMRINTDGSIQFNQAYTFPTSDGSANQVLQTDGAGNLSFSAAGSGTVDGTGTANDVAMWSDSNTLTDAPIAVSGDDVTFAGDVTLSSAGTPILKVQDTTNNHYLFMAADDNNSFMRSDGNLLLQVNAAVDTTNAAVIDSSSNVTFDGNVNITGSSKNLVLGNGGYLRFLNNAGAERNILTLDSDDDVQFGGSIDNIRFLTNSSDERMRITSTGAIQQQSDDSTPLQVTGVQNGGTQVIMRQSRGTIASPVNSQVNGDGNYLTSQIYNSGYASIGNIGIITGDALNNGIIQFQTANSGTVSEKMRIMNDGKVGIGTTSPTFPLDIEHSTEDILRLHNTTDGLDSLIKFSNAGGTLARVQGIDNGGLSLETGNNAGGINVAMRIDNAGKVGIGTTTPSGSLTIGDISTGALPQSTGRKVAIVGNGGDNNDGLIITRDNGSQNQLDQFTNIYNDGTSTFMSSGGTSTHGTYDFRSTNDAGGSSTSRLNISPTGLVGIGKSATTWSLSVKNSSDVHIASFEGSNNTGVTINSEDSTAAAIIGRAKDNSAAYNDLDIRGNTTAGSGIYIDGSESRVGIGTTTPEKQLHILSSTTDATPQLLIQNSSTGDANLTFNISGDSYSVGIDNSDNDTFKISAGDLGVNDRFAIDSSGNIGIGTSSPSEALEISGGHLKVNNAGNTSLKLNANAADSDASIFFEEADATKATIKHDASNDALSLTDGTDTELMVLKGGNVGIGTTSPDSQLHVVGNTHIYNAANLGMDAAGAGQLKVTGGATSQYSFVVSVDDAGTYLYNNGGSRNIIIGLNEVERFKLSSGGALTINQAYTFPTADGSANQVLQTDGAGNLSFAAAGGSGIDGSGTANSLPKFSDSDTVTDSTITDDGDEIEMSANVSIERTHNFTSNAYQNTKSGDEANIVTQNTYSGFGDLENYFNSVNSVNGSKFISFALGATEKGFIDLQNSSTVRYSTSSSDIRKKKNIEDWTENVLDLFRNTTPKLFNFVDEDNSVSKTKGFIAQSETEKFPEAYGKGYQLGDDDGYYSFNPSGMVPYLMKAIKELAEENDTLKNENDLIRSELNLLTARIETLESA